MGPDLDKPAPTGGGLGAGAPERTETKTLRFNSGQDAFDFAYHVVENSNRWLVSNSLNWPERYEKGNLHIVFNVRLGADDGQYDLVFVHVPSGWESEAAVGTRHGEILDVNVSDIRPDGDEQPMLGPIRHFIECPDKIVPSFVWLERAKQREDIRQQIFASTPVNYVSFQFGGAVGNGKVGVLGVGLARKNCGGKPSLVQDSSQLLSRSDSFINEVVGKRLGEFDFVSLVHAIHVWLNDTGVWFTIEKSRDPGIEVIDVFLCA
jgi:hypothetical protein